MWLWNSDPFRYLYVYDHEAITVKYVKITNVLKNIPGDYILIKKYKYYSVYSKHNNYDILFFDTSDLDLLMLNLTTKTNQAALRDWYNKEHGLLTKIYNYINTIFSFKWKPRLLIGM